MCDRIGLSFFCDSSLFRAFSDLIFMQHTLKLFSFIPYIYRVTF